MRRGSAWHFNGSKTNEATLKPLCQKAEALFDLPPKRLCRYFATWEDEYLRGINGQYYRGFHSPRSSCRFLPPYLLNCFYHPFGETTGDNPSDDVAFDNLIYIRESTCQDLTGFVLTYAHELQHFVQHGFTPKLSRVNAVLYHNLKRLEQDAIATNIPHEREANIVSKRVAETVCGVAAVRAFAKEQIVLMERAGEGEQKARWVWFRDIRSTTSCDLLRDTLPFVEKYKTVLDFEIDTEQPEWWVESLEGIESHLPNPPGILNTE